MRVNEFLRLVARDTQTRLPPRWRGFHTRTRFTLVQVYYAKRTLHYEVWVRGKERLIEIGLHFESDRETNTALLEYFSARAFEIKEALGEAVEVEQWTASWTRVHQLMPYEKLDEATAQVTAQRLAQMIEILQPMLERATVRMNPRRRTHNAHELKG
jgi:hypothetical protein